MNGLFVTPTPSKMRKSKKMDTFDENNTYN
jgi:hypothetical protein